MAKKPNGVSAEVSELLSRAQETNEDHREQSLRRHVRMLFDEAMREHDSFDGVLVALYSAGAQAVMNARPKRQRKAKPPEQVAQA